MPDSATEAAVRGYLGRRRPLGADRGAAAVDRLDLLTTALTSETAGLVVLWLGGSRRASDATRRAYADDLLAWADWTRRELGVDRFQLELLRRQHVTLWLTQAQATGQSPASIARRLATLSSLYRYAVSWGMPVASPISDDDHRPRIEKGRRATSARVITADDVAAMLGAAKDARDALVVALLFTDALRVAELCAADVSDVHDEGRRCWLAITRKGGKQVRVPVSAAVGELLDAYAAERPEGRDGALIVDAAGNRLDRHDVTRLLRRLAKAAGIPRPEKVTPHSLRASAITDQIARGKQVTEVQEMSGHADVRTVMVYVEQQGRDERTTAMSGDLSRILGATVNRFRSSAP